jgi:hypothetical protein
MAVAFAEGCVMSIERIADALGGNVVSLFTRKPPATFAAIREVESYWEALRGTRVMPMRSEIDPRGIAGALEFSFLLERIAPGAGRIRLAGMHLTDLMGMEVRGMPLTALFQPSARQGVADALESVLQRPSVAVLSLEGERGIGRGKLLGQMLLCPLKSDLGDPSRVLGCLQTDGPIGRAPRRFDVTGLVERRLDTLDMVETPDEPARRQPGPPVDAGMPGLAEAPAEFLGRPRGKPQLRLVKSDTGADPAEA